MTKSRKIALFGGVAGVLVAGVWGVSTLSGTTLWGATPAAVLDGLKLPKAVETIGNGPAVNIKGLR